jgi:hypothetical protein
VPAQYPTLTQVVATAGKGGPWLIDKQGLRIFVPARLLTRRAELPVTPQKARSVAVNYEGAANVWLAERIAEAASCGASTGCSDLNRAC